MFDYNKFLVALAILASVGLTLALPKIESPQRKQHSSFLGRWFGLAQKWNTVSETFNQVYDSVEHEWPDIQEKAKILDNTVGKDFNEAKTHTLKLLDKAKRTYKKILINGEDAFVRFHAISQDIEQAFDHLKGKGGKVFNDAKTIFNSLKEDVNEEERLIKNGDYISAIKGLQHSWHRIRGQWDKIDDDFTNMCDSTIKEYKILQKNTQVNIDGVTKDLRDVKTDVSGLLKDLRTTYKQITVDGKNSIQSFDDLYFKVKSTLKQLRPIFGENSKEIELVLNEFEYDARVIVELEETYGVPAAVAEGTVEVGTAALLA